MWQTRVHLDDVLAIKELYWPGIYFYSKQVEIIQSTLSSEETYAVAGNGLGFWPR